MIAVRSWTLLVAVVACWARGHAQGAAAGDRQAAQLTRAVAANATAIPSNVALDIKPDFAAPLEITMAPRPMLIYIPFHVSEPESHIMDMIDCTFTLPPWRAKPTYEFDVLLAISGRTSAGNEPHLKSLLDDATAGIAPRPRVFVEFVPLKSDRYVQDIAKEQKDADWVGGPNTAFYDAFLDGHIYHKYVRHYKIVQQLETDVCALKPGWLDDLVAPASYSHVLISGSTIKGDCVYIRAHDRCETNDDDHMKRHINGNALYRVGADLKAVLTQAKAAFSNAEPFDLAVYWAAQALGMEGKLHSNPLYFNIGALVDTTRLLDAIYYGGVATVVHVPRRLRSCVLRSVTSRGFAGLPLTVIVVDGKPRPSLARLIESLTRHEIDRYVLLATSEATFVELSKTYPMRVLPAFVNGVDERAPLPKTTGYDKSKVVHGGDLPSKLVLKAFESDSDLACKPWMRDDASPTGLLYTLVARMIRIGYAPFIIDQDSVVIRDYELALFAKSANGVYITAQEASTLLAMRKRSAWRPSVAYFPRSETVASAADALATLTDSDEEVPPLHLFIKRFAPHEIVQGGPFDDLSFPLVTRRKQLVRSRGAAPADFDDLVARAPPRTHVACGNYTVAVARSLDVQGQDIADVTKQVIATVAMARAHGVSCVVLPNLVFKRRSAATLFKLVDSAFFNRLAGDVRLVPSIANIDVGRARFVDVAAHHQRARTEKSACGTDDNTCLSPAVRAVLAAADSELTRDFVCVRTTGIDASDNAFVLTRHVDALARAVTAQTMSRKAFLRGTWRHLPAHTWTKTPASIATLAHVRAALQGPPSPYTAQSFGEGDSIAFDEAWADAIESIICAGAKASVTVRVDDDTTPLSPALLAGTPHAAADLADFRAWLRRPDRPSLRGPVLVMPAAASCSAWARAARLGLVLAHAARARHVVLPVAHPSWHINTTVLHAAFANVLPPTVARLLLPRLTFDALFEDGVAVETDTSPTHAYAPELTLIERTRRAAASRAVLWTANVTDSMHTALRAGLREWDWMVVVNAGVDDAAVGQALRSAVTLSDKSGGDGFAYLRRVDAVFGTVCVGAG